MQLPVLETDGQKIAQTGSILRYISRLTRKDGPDPIRAARADSAFEAAQEMPMSQIYVAVNLMEQDRAVQTAAKFNKALPAYLRNWARLLEDMPFFHGASYR